MSHECMTRHDIRDASTSAGWPRFTIGHHAYSLYKHYLSEPTAASDANIEHRARTVTTNEPSLSRGFRDECFT